MSVIISMFRQAKFLSMSKRRRVFKSAAASFLAFSIMLVPSVLPAAAGPQAVSTGVGDSSGAVSGAAGGRSSSTSSQASSLTPDSAVDDGDKSVSSADTDNAVADQAEDPDTAYDGDTKADSERAFTPLDVKSNPAAEDAATTMARLQNEAINHFEQSQFYMSKWDTELAEVELRVAIMYMPTMKAAHRDYCLVALLRGNPLRALAEFMLVVGLGDPIPISAEHRKELLVSATNLHYNKGLTHADKRNWDDAIAELQWALSYSPTDPVVHRSLAFAYAASGNFDKAELYYDSTLQLAPEDAFARADFAQLLEKKGEKDRAVDEMSRAVKLKPEATALHVDLGWLAESKGDLATARDEFNQAVKLSPSYPTLWTHLGSLYQRLHEDTLARQAFEKALAIDAQFPEAKEGLAQLLKAPAAPEDTPEKPSQK